MILINAIGALVFALLVPYIAIGRTLLYFDLQVEAVEGTGETLARTAAAARGDGRGLSHSVGFGS